MNLTPLLDAVSGASVEGADASPGPDGAAVAPTVDVPPQVWLAAVAAARDALGCTFFDFLSAVDDVDRVQVVCHVARWSPLGHVLIRTSVPADAPALASVAGVYAGARWHERETAEMFGVRFLDADGEPLVLPHLLLRDDVEQHPLRKDALLQARLDRPWPGAVEPGESEQASAPRRRLRPPGVPEALP